MEKKSEVCINDKNIELMPKDEFSSFIIAIANGISMFNTRRIKTIPSTTTPLHPSPSINPPTKVSANADDGIFHQIQAPANSHYNMNLDDGSMYSYSPAESESKQHPNKKKKKRQQLEWPFCAYCLTFAKSAPIEQPIPMSLPNNEDNATTANENLNIRNWIERNRKIYNFDRVHENSLQLDNILHENECDYDLTSLYTILRVSIRANLSLLDYT
jgi:hypothetical protein